MFLILIPTYNNIIKVYLNYYALRQKIAKKSRDKHFKYFNSTIVVEFILNKTFNIDEKNFSVNKD
jgi:hypothetical protein